MPWSQDDDDRDPRSSQIPPYFPGGDQPPPAYEYGNVGVHEGQRPPSMPPYFDSYGYAPSHVNVANSIHGQPQPQPQLPPAVAGLPQHPLPPAQPRGKPEVMAAKLASAARIQEKMDELESEGVAESSSMPEDSSKPAVGGAAAKKQATPKKRKKNPPNKAPAAKKASRPTTKSMPAPLILSMEDSVPPITPEEYENLGELMKVFCKVPLLAEFSRPVALLHPELVGSYSKIIYHPIDLGKICRSIRKREYKDLRAVRLDCWRVFNNCVKYHTHPNNKDAMPSFVSIALHLRDYFNALWQEYMIGSEPPLKSAKKNGYEARLQYDFEQRAAMRKTRLVVSGLSMIGGPSAARAADALEALIQNGGCVDRLDSTPIFGSGVTTGDDGDLQLVVDRLKKCVSRLRDLASSDEDYGIDEFDRDLRGCCSEDLFQNQPALRIRIVHRLDRFIAKTIVPVYEASCRGVTQSSIWGCIAAAVWARESSKKPFWPALVLGILAPEAQREDWHAALTERNEARLPGKLRAQLMTGKKKAETALKRQAQGQMDPQSYFLVEFLGTHEFIWVKESDLVENFNADDDPNEKVSLGSKKKRSSRSNSTNVVGSETYTTAIEEAKWALEEFEMQLVDAGGDMTEDGNEEESGEMNYSFSVLCQSDDEADGEGAAEQTVKALKEEDVDEYNELLATDGLLDYSVEGRKIAKKRVQLMKKEKANIEKEKKKKAEKAKKVKSKDQQSRKESLAKERESKKELANLQKRRKKRSREREKALKSSKKLKSSSDEHRKPGPPRRNIIREKRDRATAIVDKYLFNAAENGDYSAFGPTGTTNIPAALVESSGILGMALAFKAAARELPLGEESGKNDAACINPWDSISVDDVTSESKRMEALTKQIALLEKELNRARSATNQRRELLLAAMEDRKMLSKERMTKDKEARDNPLKKKQPHPKKAKSSPGKEESPETGKNLMRSDLEE